MRRWVGMVLLATASQAEPLRFGSAHHFLEPMAAVQLRATALEVGHPEVAGELRRARVTLKGTVADGLFRALVQVNLTPAALELVDAWVELAPSSKAVFRAGQLKTPFTRHRQGSFTRLALVDWDLASVAFGAERQRGLQWSGVVELADVRLASTVGVFTGDNARSAFARGLADAWRVRLVDASDFRTWSWGTFHPSSWGASPSSRARSMTVRCGRQARSAPRGTRGPSRTSISRRALPRKGW